MSDPMDCMPRLSAATTRPVLLLSLLGIVACETRTEVHTVATRSGTAQMVDTLSSIYARAIADPAKNPFLNRPRADALQALVATHSGPDAQQGRYLLAQERLLAGQTREAIDGLEELTQTSRVVLSPTTKQNKPFFDLLGVAYFRLGEQENCFLDPAANMCILPLAGNAKHVRQEGARKAIALYTDMLRVFPNDVGSQWLLNLAYLAVGEYPRKVPKALLIPGLDVKRDKTFPQFTNVAHTLGVDVSGLSGGVSIEDFNRDGFLDIFTTSWGLNDPIHLFLADGHGGFIDRSAQSGLKGIVGGLNNVHADYDNDGFDDILVLRGAWLGDAATQPNSLLHNRGDGTFEDVTFAAGLGSRHPTHSAAWADFNLDGKLDLFVGHESAVGQGGTSHPSELFINNGDGTFTEVSHAMGIDIDAFVKGVAWGDVNNDGLPDLYVSILGGPNRLFMNKGGSSPKTWHFEELPDAGGASRPLMSFTTWFWDFDQDGWEDLLVLSYDIRNSGALHDAVAQEYLARAGGAAAKVPMAVEPTRLYKNNRNGTFTDVTHEVGLDDKAIFAMGANFGDLDNDGWLDFYVGTGNPDLRSVIPNRMFRSVEGRRFDEVTLEGGFGHLQKGHATAFADFDRDGDEDIFMVMGGAYQGDVFTSALFENPGWKGRNWITLELEGRTANRSAIGARVEIVVADSSGVERTLHRTIGTGGSFGSGSLQLHVGLGAATTVRRLNITWPDAARSKASYSNLAVRQTYRIVQGGQPVLLVRPPVVMGKHAP
ncbi:MAG: CRTAC1 family protein [bacterium]